MKREDITNIIGMKWLTGGRDPNAGVDCWGFLKWFYANKLGIHIHEGCKVDPSDNAKIAKAFDRAVGGSNWIRLEEPEQFCVLGLSKGTKIHHVGVWVNGACLHAVEDVGVVYNSIKQLKRNGFNTMEFYRCSKL